jgi:hypothetical protein
MRQELERRLVNHPDAAALREQFRMCRHFLDPAEFFEYRQLLFESLDLERQIANNDKRIRQIQHQIPQVYDPQELILERFELKMKNDELNPHLEDLEFQINVIRHRARMYERDAEIDESLRYN